MKKIISLFCLCLLVTGCAEVREAYKYDYLDVKPALSRSRVKAITFLAEKNLLESEHRDHFRIGSVEIDELPSAPQTHKYIFVNFEPLSFQEDFQDSIYLVIFSRHSDTIVYSGAFKKSQGDPFYRYNAIVDKISP